MFNMWTINALFFLWDVEKWLAEAVFEELNDNLSKFYLYTKAVLFISKVIILE